MSRLLLLALACLSFSPFALATDVRIAIPATYADDVFVKSFLANTVPAEAGLSVAALKFLSEAEAKRAVETGAAEMSVYTITDQRLPQWRIPGTATSLLTRRFVFQSAEEVFLVEDSFVGAAAANAASRYGLFPLKLWVHGVTYFLSSEKIASVADFAKLTVAAENGAPDVRILTGVGAKVVASLPSATAGGADAMETQLGAATEAFAQRNGGKLYVTTAWPKLGALVAAHDFWLQRSETEKKALKIAADQARQAADADIVARREALRKIPNVELTNLASREEIQLTLDAVRIAPETRSQEMALWRKPEFEIRGRSVPPLASPPPPLKLAMRSPVFFVTDRNDEGTLDYSTRFGARRLDAFEFTCGFLGAPARNSGEPHVPPAPKILIKGADECARQIVAKTRESGGSKIMFVIHGFNIPFHGLALRALQLASDVDYGGAVVGWSWPSEGSAFGYAYDENSSVWSEPHLVELVNAIAAAGPEMQLDFAAHSMGCRILLQMLREFALVHTHLRIGAAVFAAPDVAQDVFREQIRLASKIGVIRTLYASEYDRAILISESYHQAPRAGSGGADILVTKGVEFVDTRLTGHSYVFDEPQAIRDFTLVLTKATAAAARGLEAREKAGERYWVIEP